MGLVTLWKNWLPWSQGVVIAPLLAKLRSPWLRVFWFAMLVATTAAFVYQSVCMVQDYLMYQKTTNIQLFYEPEAPFPAVTFCNLNPFKRSMVHRSKELSNLVAAYNYVKKVKQAKPLSTHATVLPSNGTVTPGLNRKKRAASQPAGTGQTGQPTGTGQTAQPSGAGQTGQPSGAGQTGNSSGTTKFTTTPLTTLTTTMHSTTTITTTTTAPTSLPTTTTQPLATTTNATSTTSIAPSTMTSTASTTVDVITSNAPVTADATTTSTVPTTVTTATPTTSTGPMTSTTTVLTSTSEHTSPTTASSSTGASPSSTIALTNTTVTSTSSTTTSLSTSASPSIAVTSEPSSTAPTAATTSVSTTAQSLTSSSSPLTTVASTTSASSVMTTSLMTTPASTHAQTAASTNVASTSELTTTTTAATTTASTTADLITSTTQTSITPETTTATTASTTVTEMVPTIYSSSTIAASTVTAPPNIGTSASASTGAPNTSMASGSGTTSAPAVDGGTSTGSTTIAHGTPTTGTTYVSIAHTVPAVTTTSTATTATIMTSIAASTTPFPQGKPSSTIAQSSKDTGEWTTSKLSNPTASSAPTPSNDDSSATTQVRTSSDIQATTSPTVNSSQTATETSSPAASRSMAGVSTVSPTTQLYANTEEHLADATTQVLVEHGTAATLVEPKTAATNSATPLRSSTNPAIQTGNPGVVASTYKTVQEANASSDATTSHSRPATRTVFGQSPNSATSTHGTEETGVVGNTSKPGPSFNTRNIGTSSSTPASGKKSTAAQQIYAQSSTVQSTVHSTASFPTAKTTYVGTTTERCAGCTETGELLTLTPRHASGPLSSSSAKPASDPALSSDDVPASVHPSKPTMSLASEGGTSTTVAPNGQVTASTTKRSFSDGQSQTIAAQTSSTSEGNAAPQGPNNAFNATSSSATFTELLDKTLSSKHSSFMPTSQVYTTTKGSGKSVEPLTTVHPGHTTNGISNFTTSNSTNTKRGDNGPTSDGRVSKIASVPTNVNYSEHSQKSQGTTVTTTKTLPATITVPKINLKNITVDVRPDFDLADLTDEQRKNLDAHSNAYGLYPDSGQLSIDARMKEALQVVAATMPQEMRDIVGFQLKDLVSSCIINGQPCDRDSDFKLTFDVDYGNCYTFNAGTPVKYITQRAGTSYDRGSRPGNDAISQLQGYKSSPGRLASHIVTNSKISRLGAPYGRCSTNDSIAAKGQPFYYNGSYSMEGCFRSCFQRNLAKTCGCADARFPTPTDMNVPLCDPLEPTKYKCLQAYIKMKGDYYFVDNCNCYEPCEVTRYKSQIAEGIWPAGGFFYGPYCPMAKQLNFSDCRQFYSENGMTLEVSFAQLGYELLEEEPLCTAWCLLNNLAGNTGFWVGYTMLSFTECILIAAQVVLWIFRCPKELPEVPSCRRRNFFADHEDGGSEEDENGVRGRHSGKFSPAPSTPVCDGSAIPPGGPLAALRRRASALPRHTLPPKNFDNCFGTAPISHQELRAEVPSRVELYSHESPYESVNPVAAHSTHYADRTVVE